MKDQILLNISQPRPFFAELPYYLWGFINYNSWGNCSQPTDRSWSWLELTNRDTQEKVDIKQQQDKQWIIKGESVLVARTSLYLQSRCEAKVISGNTPILLEDWNHESAFTRTHRVIGEFCSPLLKPFDSHLFWGGWKWIGWFSTDMTWVVRLILVSVLKKDPRGIFLCITWIKQGISDERSQALRHALNHITGESIDSNQEWLDWYYGDASHKGNQDLYPEPDYNKWYAELQILYGE